MNFLMELHRAGFTVFYSASLLTWFAWALWLGRGRRLDFTKAAFVVSFSWSVPVYMPFSHPYLINIPKSYSYLIADLLEGKAIAFPAVTLFAQVILLGIPFVLVLAFYFFNLARGYPNKGMTSLVWIVGITHALLWVVMWGTTQM